MLEVNGCRNVTIFFVCTEGEYWRIVILLLVSSEYEQVDECDDTTSVY